MKIIFTNNIAQLCNNVTAYPVMRIPDTLVKIKTKKTKTKTKHQRRSLRCPQTRSQIKLCLVRGLKQLPESQLKIFLQLKISLIEHSYLPILWIEDNIFNSWLQGTYWLQKKNVIVSTHGKSIKSLKNNAWILEDVQRLSTVPTNEC
jgi:hypothetical protein